MHSSRKSSDQYSIPSGLLILPFIILASFTAMSSLTPSSLIILSSFRESDTSKLSPFLIFPASIPSYLSTPLYFSILAIRGNESNSAGYYSDISIKDIALTIRKLKKKQYIVESLGNKLELSYKGKKYYAVNEILLHNWREEVYFSVYYKDDHKEKAIYPYIMAGDGMLVTSEVGSTAYNRSAGGPVILSPKLLCATFLNVYGPYTNSIILSPSSP